MGVIAPLVIIAIVLMILLMMDTRAMLLCAALIGIAIAVVIAWVVSIADPRKGREYDV